MKVFYYFLTKHKLVNLISVFLLILGFMSLSQTNIDLIPPMDFKGVDIKVSYPEASAGDMEEYVVFPLEEKLANFPNMKSISSTSSNGSARISIYFPAGYKDMSSSVAEIKENLEGLKPYLPRGIREISVKERKKTSTFQNFIYIKGVDLKNKKHDEALLGVKNKFSTLKGIAKVEDSRPKKALVINFDEQKLKEHNLTVGAIVQKISDYFNYVPLGNLSKGNEKTIFEFKHHNPEGFVDRIKALTVKSNALGYNTKLENIADIQLKRDETEYKNFHNNKETFYFRLEKDLNSDILELDAKVTGIVEDFNKSQSGIQLLPVVSGKGFIERQLTALKTNGIFGMILVLALLFVFLSFRAAICTVWGIPIAYAGTFLLIYLMGMSINLLSVVGLILVAGILVDDALIVTEKYNDLLETGMTPFDSAKNTIKELFVPVLGTAMTTLVAFLPLILIPSEMGSILFSIPVVVIGALFFSVLESFFILPSHLMTINKFKKPSFIDAYYEKTKLKYKNFVMWSVKHRYAALAVLLVFSGVSIYFSMGVEKNFNLNISDEIVMIRGKLKKSASKEETLAAIAPMLEKMESLAKAPDFVDVSTGIGSLWVDGERQVGDEYFQIRAWLDELHPQPVSIKDKLEEELKTYITGLKTDQPDTYDFINVQKGFENGENDDQKYLSISFYTKSSNQALDIENALKDFPNKIDHIGPPEAGTSKTVNKWVFDPNYEIMEQLNVNKAQVKNALLGKVQDMWINDIRVDGESISVKAVINGKEVKEQGFDPAKVFLVTQNDSKVSLASLGSWKSEKVLEKIRHLNGFRVQSLKFPITDNKKRDEVLEKSKPLVAGLQKDFPHYIIKSFGESIEEAENRQWILKALFACLLGIYFVLVLVLGSFTQPIVVSLPILFGFIGVFLAHKLHDMPIGVLSGVGLIGAIGVSVNGSLIMADQINMRLRNFANRDVADMISLGASSRFRAIVLTSLTTLGGLFPMAYGLGGDSGFTKALAFSMAWGILLASVLTLFFFPAVFAVLHDCSQIKFFKRKKTKKIEVNSRSNEMSI